MLDLRRVGCAAWVAASLVVGAAAIANAAEKPTARSDAEIAGRQKVLSPQQWKRVDAAVDRGLAYLAQHQQADGSIEAPATGQPGITSLAVMAFLSRGHIPGEGPYGSQLSKAIDFVVACQRDDGLLSAAEPETYHLHNGASHTGNYNHAIAGLMLAEVYGMVPGSRHEKIAATIRRALKFTREQQTKPHSNPREDGGWRYLRQRWGGDADISATSWQIMFYRSARNAQFDVPKTFADEALHYIRLGFDPQQRTFTYNYPGGLTRASTGVVGGAIVCLELGGDHQSRAARQAGDWILRQPIERYNWGRGPYHYGAYYCSQGMFQLGGQYWKGFFPRLADTLLENQANDGSWERENDENGDYFGRCYTTALSVLALTPAYQLLPIYQR